MNWHYRPHTSIQTRPVRVVANACSYRRSDIYFIFAEIYVEFTFLIECKRRLRIKLNRASRPWSWLFLRGPKNYWLSTRDSIAVTSSWLAWLVAKQISLLCSLIFGGLGIRLFL
jgi:hypothetical protein